MVKLVNAAYEVTIIRNGFGLEDSALSMKATLVQRTEITNNMALPEALISLNSKE